MRRIVLPRCRVRPSMNNFAFADANGRPLASAYYTARLPSGAVLHGTPDSQGRPGRYETEDAQSMHIFIPVIEGGGVMPDALGAAVTNTDPNSCVVVRSGRLCKPWAASSQILTFMAVWESGRLNGITRVFRSGHPHIDVPVSEGFILVVYPDNHGNPTVGCGHLVLPEDNLHLGQTISIERARKFLKKDLQRAEHAINSKVHVPLFQHEYDALASISFNAGAGHAADELTRCVNQGNYGNMPDYIEHFRRGSSLHQRRKAEARVFSKGVYDASH